MLSIAYDLFDQDSAGLVALVRHYDQVLGQGDKIDLPQVLCIRTPLVVDGMAGRWEVLSSPLPRRRNSGDHPHFKIWVRRIGPAAAKPDIVLSSAARTTLDLLRALGPEDVEALVSQSRPTSSFFGIDATLEEVRMREAWRSAEWMLYTWEVPDCHSYFLAKFCKAARIANLPANHQPPGTSNEMLCYVLNCLREATRLSSACLVYQQVGWGETILWAKMPTGTGRKRLVGLQIGEVMTQLTSTQAELMKMLAKICAYARGENPLLTKLRFNGLSDSHLP